MMRVVEVFDSLQGEGLWVGTPMTFVRLAGCNAPDLGLGCVRWCDTKYAWQPGTGEDRPIEDVAAAVKLPRCCLTGGEPLLQGAEVACLIEALHRRGVAVHLETNGTLELGTEAHPDWITVSPKPPAYTVAPRLAARADEIKLVVDEPLAARGAPVVAGLVESIIAPRSGLHISLQPEASGGVELARRVAGLVLANPTWRLSVQLHTILGLR